MDEIGRVVEMRRAVAFATRQRHREVGAAVIGADARDQMPLLRLAAPRVIVMDQAHGGVVRRRAGAGIEYAVEIAGREARQLGRQLHRRRIGGVDEGGIEAEAPDLVGDRLGHLLLAEADRHAPQAADAVEIALAPRIGDVRALGAGDDQRAFLLEAVEMGEGMDEVRLVVAPDAVGVVVRCRRRTRAESSTLAHDPNSLRSTAGSSVACGRAWRNSLDGSAPVRPARRVSGSPSKPGSTCSSALKNKANSSACDATPELGIDPLQMVARGLRRDRRAARAIALAELPCSSRCITSRSRSVRTEAPKCR